MPCSRIYDAGEGLSWF